MVNSSLTSSRLEATTQRPSVRAAAACRHGPVDRDQRGDDHGHEGQPVTGMRRAGWGIVSVQNNPLPGSPNVARRRP